MTWPNYSKQDLEIHVTETFEVYDPWLAQIRGVFESREDAERFAAMVRFTSAIERGCQ